MTVPRALTRLAHGAASDPIVPWLLAAAYVAVGIYHVSTDAFLNDEGLLAYFFAGMLWDAPLDIFFWQKSRPVLSLAYAPAAAIGATAFLILHVLVASLSGPLVASLARRWRHRFPNLGAALVLLSPLMVAAGPAGVTNADAVTLAVLAVWLAERGSRVAAGVVLGSLLLVRSELAVLVLTILSLVVVDRRFLRVVLGVLALPAAYFTLGALYHHDLLWALHYPPSLLSSNPGNPIFQQLATPGSPWDTASVLLALTPAVGLAALTGIGRMSMVERAGVVFAVGYLVIIRVLPYLGAFNFGSSPRYALPALPFLALMASRAVSRWDEAGDRWWSAPWLIGLLVLGHLTATFTAWPWLLLAVAAWSGLVALARLRRTGVAASLTFAGAALAAPCLLPLTELEAVTVRREVAPAVAWLTAHPREAGRGPVLTNMHLLETHIQREGGVPALEVRQLVQADQLVELVELSNPHVGQRERILSLLDRHFYAKPLFPDALGPDKLPRGALFVLSDDGRLESVMPRALWEPRLETLARGESWRILRLRESP